MNPRKISLRWIVYIILIIFLSLRSGITQPAPAPPGPAPPGPAPPGPAPPGPAPANATHYSPTLVFGQPEIFISTESQSFDPYFLFSRYRGTSMMQEYVMYAKGQTLFRSNLTMFSSVSPDIVEQNLGKERYWAFLNNTGCEAWYTMLNTTHESSGYYTVKDESNRISYIGEYKRDFISTETIPPYDLIFEIPKGTRSFRATKVMIDLHSWGLLRWQLSDSDFVNWEDIKDSTKQEALDPDLNPSIPQLKWIVAPGNFERLHNPCLHDAFLMYIIVGDVGTPNHHVYADIPVFHLNQSIPNFINLTGSFCPNQKEASKEECGHPRQLVLTNDHLIALTDKGLYVSASLKRSDKDVSVPHSEKPLLSYELIDPCEQFDKHISCFRQGKTSLTYDLIHSIRLFYVPVCILYLYPFPEDRLIVVIEHTTTQKLEGLERDKSPPMRAITALYSSAPYRDWKSLFIGKNLYNDSKILELVGIFFNAQLRHFDITLKILDKVSKNFEHVRFILLDPPEPEDPSSERSTGYQELNGLMGMGFLEKRFPKDVDISEVVVSPVTMDVFFLGNQLWIAESGLSLVYQSIVRLHGHGIIKRCSFNHPDRTYVCVSADNKQLLVGRVGVHYGPTVVDTKTIREIWEAGGIKGSYWTPPYSDEVIDNAHYVAGYSGKILMWYLFEETQLRNYQLQLKSAFNDPKDCETRLFDPPPSAEDVKKYHFMHTHLQQSCNQLVVHTEDDWRRKPIRTIRGPFFRLLAINPYSLSPEEIPTDGPLVPLLIDATTVMLMEAELPGIEQEHVYFNSINVGKRIQCRHSDKPEENCNIYLRHIKSIKDKDVLTGFNQILFGTLMKPFPLGPVSSEVLCLQIRQSNLVFLWMKDLSYTETHVGWSQLFPGRFSVLLRGFPDPSRKNIMWGHSTSFVRHQQFVLIAPYRSWLVDFSTEKFRKERMEIPAQGGDNEDQKDWKEYIQENVNAQKKEQELAQKDADIKVEIQRRYELSPFRQLTPALKLFTMYTAPVIPLFNALEALDEDAKERGWPTTASKPIPEKINTSWIVVDGGCQHNIALLPNPVLKSHGGRIQLDLHDSISFSIKIKAISEVGRLTIYRPLFVMTNSNPAILKVEKKITTSRTDYSQTADIVLTPTGASLGISNFMVRPVITSMECQGTTSVTLIVEVHRRPGRRLQVNYPFPVCSTPAEFSGWIQNYKNDSAICISAKEILEAGMRPDGTVIRRESTVIFTKLVTNYRPPSSRGERIPLSSFTYNADPSKDHFHEHYHVSKDTQKYRKCGFRRNRAECGCSEGDKLSDHPDYSDCKEMVFTVQRAKAFSISLEYEPLMLHENQHGEFFDAKDHLSVYIEEVNQRTEYTLYSFPTFVVDSINSDERLSNGKKFYDAAGINITLHGTGLYHFKASLGKFDSFEDVSGHFILYSDSNELNHVRLAVVMLLTITFCFSLVFFGFIRVRRRLSSQLPFQAKTKGKIKEE